jgi:tRNA threonylcarbamoyladenosine biosynthesis protein TsaE
VIALNGTLGSGKTRLTQAIAKSLEIAEPVVSPTYTICVPYAGRLRLLHMDAYRIAHPEEVDELDLFDRVDSGEILICEWADRVAEQLPEIDLTISMVPVSQFSRTASITGHSAAGLKLIAGLRKDSL